MLRITSELLVMKFLLTSVYFTLCLLSFAEQPFLKKQAEVKGLLVSELGNGELVGTAAQMNATVITGAEESPFEVRFNQDVGELMDGATEEVFKYISVNNDVSDFSGYIVELAFANKYTPKDGPSAAVVCTLMVDSILTGKELDPTFAATGDMTATGDVRPVGGVDKKILGAIKKGCEIVGIPKVNEHYMADLYVMEGLKPIYEIQVFSLDHISDAQKLAYLERPSEVQQAIKEFQQVQLALRNNEKFIFNKKVIKKLKAVGQLCPNHLSAKYLLLHALKRGPKRLSLSGSLTGIDNAGGEFYKMLDDQTFLDTKGGSDVLAKFVFRSAALQRIIDPRTRDYAKSYNDLAAFFKSVRTRKGWNGQLQRELDAKVNRVNSARNTLLNSQDVREELLLE